MQRQEHGPLATFWSAEREIYERKVEGTDTMVGLVPQLFNYKLITGPAKHWESGYEDGY